jgi:hypothetical protein
MVISNIKLTDNCFNKEWQVILTLLHGILDEVPLQETLIITQTSGLSLKSTTNASIR